MSSQRNNQQPRSPRSLVAGIIAVILVFVVIRVVGILGDRMMFSASSGQGHGIPIFTALSAILSSSLLPLIIFILILRFILKSRRSGGGRTEQNRPNTPGSSTGASIANRPAGASRSAGSLQRVPSSRTGHTAQPYARSAGRPAETLSPGKPSSAASPFEPGGHAGHSGSLEEDLAHLKGRSTRKDRFTLS